MNSSSNDSSSRICFTTSFFSNPPAPRNVASSTRAIPPRASSRSRTYLPKTWGYIGARGALPRSYQLGASRDRGPFVLVQEGSDRHDARDSAVGAERLPGVRGGGRW